MTRKIVPNGRTYRQRIAILADSFLNIRDCRLCGSPLVEGYVCIFCKGDDTAVRS